MKLLAAYSKHWEIRIFVMLMIGVIGVVLGKTFPHAAPLVAPYIAVGAGIIAVILLLVIRHYTRKWQNG